MCHSCASAPGDRTWILRLSAAIILHSNRCGAFPHLSKTDPMRHPIIWRFGSGRYLLSSRQSSGVMVCGGSTVKSSNAHRHGLFK